MSISMHQIVDLSTKSSVVYQELFCMIALSASSSKPDDDDRNEEIKKKSNRFNLFCEQKKGALHFLTTFLCCYDQNVNAIIGRERSFQFRRKYPQRGSRFNT